MIPQSIINRLGLLPTNHQMGVSFITNSAIMSWPKSPFLFDTYVADCGLDGYPLEGKLLIFTNPGDLKYILINTDLLEDQDFDIVSTIKKMLL